MRRPSPQAPGQPTFRPPGVRVLAALPLLLGLSAPVFGQVVPRAAEADPYEVGLQLVEAGRWQEALELWEDARDDLSARSVRDPRIGVAYIEVATRHEAAELYATASGMLLWGLSGTPVEGASNAIRQELERVRLILPEDDLREWQTLDDAPDSEVLLKLKRFWLEKDPTPTTEVNERLIEHWRRIADARRRFVFNKSSAIDTDDRGVIFLRFGEPARADRGSLGASEQEMRLRVPGARHATDRASLRQYDTNPQYEVWVYDRLNEQGFTYFLFGNTDGTGPFELVRGVYDLIPPQAKSRASARNTPGGIPAAFYLELFYYQDLSVVGGHFGSRFGELDRLWNLYSERRRTTLSATGAAPRESEVEALRFKFRDEDEYNPPFPPEVPVLSEYEGRSRDEVVAQVVRTLSDDGIPLLVVLSASAPRMTADRSSAYRQELVLPGWTMRHSLIIRDDKLDEVGRLVQPVDPRRADVASFVLRHPPRSLHLTLTAQTLRAAEESDETPVSDTLVASNRLPGQVHMVPGPPLTADTARFEMSDLLTGTPFPPGLDLATLPYEVLPSRTLWRRDPLRVYLELYHIGFEAGATDVTGLFRVVPLRDDGEVDPEREPITLDDLRLTPPGTTYREFFDISLRDQEPGRYRLEVEITDGVRGQRIRRTAEIRLMN